MTSPTELVSSPAVNLSFAETGPIPNNQCALKDALLLALQTGETDAATIVGNAQAFLAFLDGAGVNQPTAFAPTAPAPAAPDADAGTIPAGATPGVTTESVQPQENQQQ